MNSSNTPSNTSSNANAISSSGIVVPVHYARLSLTSIGKVAEVKVGDVMKAGDVVVRLDAPDLQFTVNAAEAALRSAQLEAELQRYGRVKERRKGKTLSTQLPKEYIELADIKGLQALGMAAVAFWRAGLMVKMIRGRFGLLTSRQAEARREA